MLIKTPFFTFQILPRWNYQKGCRGHASCSQRGQLSGAAQRDPEKCLLLVTQVSTHNKTIREKWQTGEAGKLRVGFPCCPFMHTKTQLHRTQLYCIQAYSDFSVIPLINTHDTPEKMTVKREFFSSYRVFFYHQCTSHNKSYMKQLYFLWVFETIQQSVLL